MPSGTRRVILPAQTHSLSGSVQLPNGATDFGRGFGATGPGWCAYGTASVSADTCSASFETRTGDDSTEWVTASMILGAGLGAVTGGFDLDDVPGLSPAPNYGQGRGAYGDTISGSFLFSVQAELVLYTFGEADIEIPDDGYPSYGGVRIVGEFPSNYAIMVWEPVEGAEVSGTITLGSKSLTLTAPSSVASFTTDASIGAGVYHTQAGDGSSSFLPLGVVETIVSLSGSSASGVSASKTFYSGGATVGGGEIGPGYARAWTDTAVGSVAAGSDGSGIGASGFFTTTRKAALHLDAMAMHHAHPHACVWKAILGYKGVTDTVDVDGYRTIIDPPEPIVTTLTGQSVSATIVQESYGLAVGCSKGYDSSSGTGIPARGTLRDGVTFVTYDHYENQQGPVSAWIVPPPGEQANDWRVGLRGKAGGGLTISRDAALSVALGSGTADGDDAVYSFGTPKVFEGYRLATATGSASKWKANAKTFDLGADLCFPDEGGPSVERQDTRFPLDSSRRSTIETALWGLTNVSQIRAVGGSLDSLTLGGSGDVPKVHALACFVQWEQEVPDDEISSGGDTYTVEHYCSRGLIADSSGRLALEIPHVRKTVNNAPGRLWSDDYLHLSCSAMASLVGETPGWSATTQVDAWGDDPPGWFACQGYVRQGGTWTKQWEIGPGAIVAQPVYDSVEWPGGIGDVFDVGLGGGDVLGLIGRKIFRGSAYGPTEEDTTVHYSDLPGGSSSTFDQATTDKRYFVGPTLSDPNDWGNVWVDPGHKASFGSYPRRIERGAFGLVQVVVGDTAVMHTPDGTWWRASIETDGLIVRTALSGGPKLGWYSEKIVSTDDGDREPCLTWDPVTGLAHLTWERDDGVYRSTSNDHGKTWSEPMPDTVIPDGKMVRYRHVYPDGDGLYTAIVDDGGAGAGKLVGAWRGRGDTAWSEPFDVIDASTGVAFRMAGTPDAPVGYDHCPSHMPDGRWSLGLLRDGDSSPSDWYSVHDGRKFESAT